MKIIRKIKDWFYNKTIGYKIQKDFAKEVADDFLYNKYQIMKINDFIGEYKRGGNPFTILRKIGDIL